jgi:hypothetical protein
MHVTWYFFAPTVLVFLIVAAFALWGSALKKAATGENENVWANVGIALGIGVFVGVWFQGLASVLGLA